MEEYFYLFTLLLILYLIFVTYVKLVAHNYWSRQGLQISPNNSTFFGHILNVILQKETLGIFLKNSYDNFRSRHLPHGGIYLLLKPIYIPTDPDIIKKIVQNDFHYFVNRGIYYNEEVDPLSAHLFSLEGAKWKNLRAKLTPAFTSGKMKMMFNILVKCGDQLIEEMNKRIGKEIEMKNILQRFTTDIIGNCAFGIDCNSLRDAENEFNKYGRLFFQKNLKEHISMFFQLMTPNTMKKLNSIVVRPELSKFFLEVVEKTVHHREANNNVRRDFMHLLLQLKNYGKLLDEESVLNVSSDSKNSITFNELAAQAFVFFIAGFETSSTTMTFCLYELASNQKIQNKLRKEINDVLYKHNGNITYEALIEMSYLEKVIFETLRKYPPIPVLNRVCNKNYNIPGTEVVLEKGTYVFIPILGLHRDEVYYPNPEKFDPERFSNEEKKIRHPYTFLPFGEGPRICIGLRFGMMQIKVGLCVLLRKYIFSINAKTKQPIQLDPQSIIMSPRGGLWLDYKKVQT